MCPVYPPASVPILIGDPLARSFAAVHAGWRGTSASIVRRAIEQMESEYGAQATNMRAAIGPAANVCCYEVGSDVIDLFEERFPQSDHLVAATRHGGSHSTQPQAH